MTDYQPNSLKSRAEKLPEKNVKKVISGSAQTKKKSEMVKFAEVFLAEDINSVRHYITGEVIIPTIKKAVYDILTNGLDMVFFGSSGQSAKKSPASRISYRSYYDDNRDTRRESYRPMPSYRYNDITFDSRGEAEEVLSGMYDILETYKVISVADFYDLAGITGTHTDNKYGWMDLRNPDVTRTRDGRYMIRLPKAMPID